MVKTGKPQAFCPFSTSAPSTPIGRLHSEYCPATEKSPSKLAGVSLSVTASNPSKTTTCRDFTSYYNPLSSSHHVPPLQNWHTQYQSPQEHLAKHKNSLFVSLLLKIRSMQDVHFHAPCVSCNYSRGA